MCGRPTIGLWSPLRLLDLPLAGLEPLARQKASVVLYLVLAGFSIYALIRDGGSGRLAALLGGLVYPIMPAHVARAVVHGHVHILRFYAFLPLLMLVLFRLRARDWRAVARLGLVLAACLICDGQRALLVSILLGMLLAGEALLVLVMRLAGSPRSLLVPAWSLLGFGAAFSLAVGIDAFELVNGAIGDSYRLGFQEQRLEQYIDRWSLDNLYTFVDRAAFLGDRFEDVIPGVYTSKSRYLGLSLLAYVLAVALRLVRLPGQERRFWMALALLAVGIWMAIGPEPLAPKVLGRWSDLFQSDEVGPGEKLAFAAALVALAGLAIAIATRSAFEGRRWRWVAGAALAAGVLGAFHFVAPFPIAKRLFFFLRDQRNPDWWQVAVSSFAVAWAASLAAGGLIACVRGRRAAWALGCALISLPIADFWWYRSQLVDDMRPWKRVDAYAQAFRVIGADPEYFRVLGVEANNSVTDSGALWHGKRLAWDFRYVSAPLRTRYFMNVIHWRVPRKDHAPGLAMLAGMANVKYLVDRQDISPNLRPSALLKAEIKRGDLVVWRNLAYRPYVHAWPEAHLVVGPIDAAVVPLAAALASRNVGLVHVAAPPAPELGLLCAQTYVLDDPAALAAVPAGTLAFLGSFVPAGRHALELRFERPASYWVFGGVSLVSLGGAIALALRRRRRQE